MSLTKVTYSMIDGATVNATDYGFSTSGTALANQTALAAALATNRTVYIPQGTYVCSPGLTVDLGKQSLLGDNAILDFSSITGTQVALTLTNTSTLTPGDLVAPSAIAQKIDGFILLGNGKAGSGAAAGTTTVCFQNNTAHTCVTNCLVYGFGYGIKIFTNGYIQSYIDVNVGQCAIGVFLPSGGSNYGERISFVNCVIYDNILGISNNCNIGAIQFTNCSLDYNVKTLVATNNSITELHSTWWECLDAGAGNVVASLDNCVLKMFGGHIQQNGTPTALAQSGFFNTNNAAVFLNNVFMFNLQNTANVLDSGNGAIIVNETDSYAVSYLPSKTAPVANNKLSDSSFETANIADWWSINSDTTTITNRFTGANITLALSSTYAYSGTKSLKIVKTSSGANGGFILVVPVNPFARCAFTGWYKFPAASGPCFVTTGACLVNGPLTSGIPSIGNSVTFDTQGIGNSASAIDWTQITTGMDRVAPSWANYFFISFNLFSFSGDLYLDDFTVVTM
jgi:hypothetical protein